MTLQPESAIPLYIQIKELLHEQIAAGRYAAGSRLPSERALARQFEVSRMTARQALQALAREGMARMQVGKGTFVSAQPISQELWTLTSFSEDMRRRGMRPSSRVRRAMLVAADRDLALHLQVAPKTEIAVLSRARLADDRPLALETTHIPHHLCPGLLDGKDFSQESLYDVLQRDYGVIVTWAMQTIRAGLPNDDERDALGIDAHTPVLRLSRVTYNDGDRPIEYVQSVYRSDEYEFRAILRHARIAGNGGQNGAASRPVNR